MPRSLEVHCNGFTRRVSHVIPFLPLSVAELEDAATAKLIKKRQSAFKTGLALGWTEGALELISSGTFEDTKARLKILDANLVASMYSSLGGMGVGRNVSLIYDSLDCELSLKFSHPTDEKSFEKVIEEALSPTVKEKKAGWTIESENMPLIDEKREAVVREPSASVTDAPKLRKRNRPKARVEVNETARKRAETNSVRLSTLTRQATLSPSRSGNDLKSKPSSKSLRSLIGLSPKEMAVRVVEQREKREVAKVETSIRNVVKAVRRRMSIRKSEENVQVKEIKSEAKAQATHSYAVSAIAWKVKALLAVLAVAGLATILGPVVLPVAATVLEMTFLTALAPYAGILFAVGAIILGLLYQFPALRKFAWRAAKWLVRNWRVVVGGFGLLLLIWIAFVLMKIFKNVQDVVAGAVGSQNTASPSSGAYSSALENGGVGEWDIDGDGKLSATELLNLLKSTGSDVDAIVEDLLAMYRIKKNV